MNDEETLNPAQVTPLKTISKVWLIPIVAILIGSWMIFVHFNSKGPLIRINFETAEGIIAGKTKIKLKNVDVGLVELIELSKNLETVIITARINKHDINLLKEDSQFWVVRPRIGNSGISGLGTLFSGAYIEVAPGTSDDKNSSFVGLENEPVTASGTKGLHLTLESGAFRSLNIGDQILFHGIEVGRIEFVYFNPKERKVYYDAFIESPYDDLITSNTKFWELNGFEVELSADGIQVQTGTLETMISGGVSFDVPNNMPPGDIISERKVFTVYPSKNSIYENQYNHSLQFVLLFKDSIRGLKPGAPVEYRGIKIGNVTRTDINYPEISNVLKKDTLIPVMINIEPGRMGFEDTENILPQVKNDLSELISRGLRGGLSLGNLLTGSKYIELEYDEGVNTKLQYFSSYLVIPTLQGQFIQIMNKISKIMDKLYSLPLEPVISTADQTLKQLTMTLQEFGKTSRQLEILLKQSTQQNLVASIKNSLEAIAKLAVDFSEGSLTHEEFQNTLRFMKKTLRELEPLLRQLNQKPNSLIFSSQKNNDVEPKGQ